MSPQKIWVNVCGTFYEKLGRLFQRFRRFSQIQTQLSQNNRFPADSTKLRKVKEDHVRAFILEKVISLDSHRFEVEWDLEWDDVAYRATSPTNGKIKNIMKENA